MFTTNPTTTPPNDFRYAIAAKDEIMSSYYCSTKEFIRSSENKNAKS